MHGRTLFRDPVDNDENISRTLLEWRVPEKANPKANPNAGLAAAMPEGCRFIAAETWPAGAPPFCGAPVKPGSAYCAAHAGRCAVDPASRDGAELLRAQEQAAQKTPPPELRHLEACAVLEADESDAGFDADLGGSGPTRPRRGDDAEGDES